MKIERMLIIFLFVCLFILSLFSTIQINNLKEEVRIIQESVNESENFITTQKYLNAGQSMINEQLIDLWKYNIGV